MIETRNLTKRYGNLVAVNNINLKLGAGDVFGFIGPNGSGKTTTMRMIATLLNPDHGEEEFATLKRFCAGFAQALAGKVIV